jgi:hypothetical protein
MLATSPQSASPSNRTPIQAPMAFAAIRGNELYGSFQPDIVPPHPEHVGYQFDLLPP